MLDAIGMETFAGWAGRELLASGETVRRRTTEPHDQLTPQEAQIAQLARALLTDVCRPFQLNQHEVFLTASIGIAFCPRDAENVIDLIRNADAAMYYSKQNGGNTFAFYSPEMNAAAVERLMPA